MRSLELVSPLAKMKRAPLYVFVDRETGVRRVACGCLGVSTKTKKSTPQKTAKKEKEEMVITKVWDWLESSSIILPDSPMSP